VGRVEPSLRVGQVAVAQNAREGDRRLARLGIVVHVGERRPDPLAPPRPPAAAPRARRLLDEAVLRELTQVERARRRALTDALARLRGGQLAGVRQHLEQPYPQRVGQRSHRPGIGQLPQRFERRHVSKDSFRK
jgi:hypothetical protein